MLLNDKSLMDGLSSSFNLTNQDFYACLVDEKKTKKTIVSLQAVPSPSSAHFDFPSSLWPATQALRSMRNDIKTVDSC